MTLEIKLDSKTQIKHLVNGDKSVYRDVKHPKYLGVKQTSLNQFSGSSPKERIAVRLKVLEENPKQMRVILFGREVTLERLLAVGQVVNFVGEITENDFLLFTGNKSLPVLDRERKCILTITDNMTVQVEILTRRSENLPWRSKGWQYIDESFVSIY